MLLSAATESYLCRCLGNLVNAVLQALFVSLQLSALFGEQRLVERPKLQVALGRGVVVSPHGLQKSVLRLNFQIAVAYSLKSNNCTCQDTSS